MRILLIHNKYRLTGGEESVVEQEASLLMAKGHTVATLFRDNTEIDSYGFTQRLRLFFEAAWSQRSFKSVRDAVLGFRADVVHVHNTHLLWTPSVFPAARQASAATVMTLHNFRVACMNSALFRDGKDCTECIDHGVWQGVAHRCYHDSLTRSVAMARVIHVNGRRRTWKDEVDAFIAMTEKGKEIFMKAGLPASRIHIKPNFLQDPLEGKGAEPAGRGALFIGRLTPIKGVEMLLSAWRGIDYPLTVVGTGPSKDSLLASAPSNVEFTGLLSFSAIRDLIRGSSFVVFPSLCRETFGRVIIESFSMGRPVIASRHGAMAEIIRHDETGLLYEPGNAEDLRDKVLSLTTNVQLAERLGRAARLDYLERYTADTNYTLLMAIYRHALNRRHGPGSQLMVG